MAEFKMIEFKDFNEPAITSEILNQLQENMKQYADDLVLEKQMAENPVGHIRIEEKNIDPATYLGFGKWTLIKDVFVLAAGDNHKVNDVGGSEKVKLDPSHLPAHTHPVTSEEHAHLYGAGNSNCDSAYGLQEGSPFYAGQVVVNYNGAKITTTSKANVSIGEAGGGLEHENMPPYITKYYWQRIA